MMPVPLGRPNIRRWYPQHSAPPKPQASTGCPVILVDPDHPQAMECRARLMATGLDVYFGVNGVPSTDYALILVPIDSRHRSDVAGRLRDAREVFPDSQVCFVNISRPWVEAVSADDVEDMYALLEAANISFVAARGVPHAS